MSETKTGQIKWYLKNKIDLENQDVQIQVTDALAQNAGQEFVNYMRNRNNFSAWLTTESVDASNTEMIIGLGGERFISDILIVRHNLKSYSIQYRKGISAWTDFSTPINPSNDTESTTSYIFNLITATEIRIIITGTQIPDTDKRISQLIITESIGQFEGWPVVKKPTISTNKRKTQMLSGKTRIVESLESFSCSLNVRHWAIQKDVDILEEIYFKREGVLMYINADDPDQFVLDLKGYRKEDIFLVRPTDDLASNLLKDYIEQE